MSRPCLDDRRGVGVRLRSAVFGCLLGLALAGAWVAGARALDPAPDQDALVTLAQLVETEHRRVDLLVEQGRHTEAIAALDALVVGPWPATARTGEAGLWIRHDAVGRLVRLELDHGAGDASRLERLRAQVSERLEDAGGGVVPNAFTARLAGLEGELHERLGEDDEALKSYGRALDMNKILLDALVKETP